MRKKKNKSSGLFKSVIKKNCLQIVYIYKHCVYNIVYIYKHFGIK